MNQNDLHFSSCRELPYIDYYQGAAAKKQSIAVEVMTPLYLDGQRISTLISSPEDIDVLAVGYCLAEEKIPAGRKLAGVCLHDGAAWVTTETGTARAVEKPPFVPITAEKLYSYGGLLDSLSTAHHASHGVHEGALVQGDEVLVYTEDIGRHNVLDRLRGFVELQHIDVSQAVLVFSGPNRSSKRSMAWAFASWHRGPCRRVWACPWRSSTRLPCPAACGLILSKYLLIQNGFYYNIKKVSHEGILASCDSFFM